MAEERCGVRYISSDRSGWPRCNCSGSGATSRNDSAVSSARRYVGRTASTRNTRSRDARTNAPATRPVMNGYSTISTDHCSSTSFGYMKPSTPGIIHWLLSDGPVQVLVVHLRLGSHLRLQNGDLVVAQEFVDRVVGILEVDKLARLRRAVFAARGRQALGDAVVTERALVGGLGLGMQITAAVGAGLHTVTAAQAVVFIHQHHAVRADERRPHRADLHAGRIGTMVAKLRHEEALHRRFLDRRKSVDAAVGR